MAVAAVALTGCGNSAPKADMKSDVDSLSYAFGIEQSQAVDRFLDQMEVDSTDMDEFLKGVSTATEGTEDKKKKAYYIGVMVGVQLNMMQQSFGNQIFEGDSTKTLSLKNLVAGFVAGSTNKDAKMTSEQARMFLQKKSQELQAKQAEKKFADNKKKSEDFMKANAKKEGVKTLGKGVQYKVIKEGTGAMPKPNSIADIDYEGRTIDGKVFDKNENAKMPLSGAIPGFTEALAHMPVGSKWEIYIPYSAAYGSNQAGPDIKPFSALVFVVELVSIEEAPKPIVTPQPKSPTANK